MMLEFQEVPMRGYFFAVLTVLTFSFITLTAFGQDVVRCSSDNGRRNYCDVGPNREIRFARQVSGSACISGTTYGIERTRIWVDRGCRADFQVLRSQGDRDDRRNGSDRDLGQDRNRDQDWGQDRGQLRTYRTNCDSNDMGYHTCDTGGEIVRARMIHQNSGSPCTEGRSWGHRGSQLWVDHGCRAEFEVAVRGRDGEQDRSGQDRGGFQIGGRSRTFNMQCDSNDMGYHACPVQGEVVRARMMHQNSGSACTEGRSWGYRRGELWVDHGCRAEFEVTTR
jgi:hypothetical protein